MKKQASVQEDTLGEYWRGYNGATSSESRWRKAFKLSDPVLAMVDSVQGPEEFLSQFLDQERGSCSNLEFNSSSGDLDFSRDLRKK